MFLGTMKLFLLFLCIGSVVTEASERAKATSPAAPFDVIHYDAQVEPDFAKKNVAGRVLIKLKAAIDDLATVELDCGDLTIDAVRENSQEQKFVRTDRRLVVSLTRPAKINETRELEVHYHGTPARGIRFFPEQEQVYTVFSTSEWLVCVDAPDDKATLRLNLILPATLNAVGNGRLAARHTSSNNKVMYEWRQEMAIPTYTFGFAAGHFRSLTEKRGHVQLRYLGMQFSDEELRRMFRDTSDAISFYEDRSGVRYADATYTQVLATGRIEQEMSGFTVIRESYGRDLLTNERDVWLMAHELAHQWWGNRVTCRDWTHFWLNEGMATFMAAAYKERRVGREEYLREIEQHRTRYEKVRDLGKDRSLHFPDWLHPTPEDRALVYQKGAYVLHLLREELDEQLFWKGIRQYTRKYFGKSVTTADFQTAMEQATGKNLTEFFSKWVYLTQR